MTKYHWQTVGLGALAGFRSMTAPALLSSNLHTYHPQALAGSPLRYMQKNWVGWGFRLLSVGETIGDKLSGTPDRIAAAGLLGRAASGALVGATIFRVSHDKPLNGAVLGGLAAVAATYLSYFLRKRATLESGLPGGIVGGLEDLVALGFGLALTKGTDVGKPQPRSWNL
ncbi:hypothetical protein CDA63_17195 [Hymenobacter amundsenii]|uniref:DUF4126 domain-containing protein n=1 Tax=Hymenobacter amundsenii TaxID=2006685 RepID=A0A246FJU0_9BACT|nr:DUF4126 family protein [Hymenobacter amundsenii]OWP61875.1 hypothetical protein CDA63_17195 [Hymenobacter amundsenii]